MKYYVIGIDGNKYGPCEISTLKDWAKDGRLTPESTLIDEEENMCKAKEIITNFPVATPAFVNDSGSGSKAVIPYNLKGLSWGGFLLSPFWGFTHKITLGYVAFGLWIFSLIISTAILQDMLRNPNVMLQGYYSGISWLPTTLWKIINTISGLVSTASLIITFIFLFKGREMAWQSRRFESMEQFNAIQKKWTTAGLIYLGVSILLGIATGIYIVRIAVSAVQTMAY